MKTIGILGGGQLGAYLCQAARKLGFDTRVLVTALPSSVDGLADYIHVGALDDVAAVMQVAHGSDVLTYEIESIGPECLGALLASAQTVHPSPQILRTLQNKITQREFYAAQQFPSPLWLAKTVVEQSDYAEIAAALGSPFVQKAATGGYDGRGVQVVRSAADMRTDFSASLFESMVPIKSELGLLVARTESGELHTYPPVEMRFLGDNILDIATCPSTLGSDIDQAAMQLAQQVIDALGGVGLFCLELFVDTDDRILVNELAARVHNSGHLTIEACATSQYEQHLRAITGMPLGSVELTQPSAMKNLLSRPLPTEPEGFGVQNTLSTDACKVHWYMKPDARQLRKMGHITAVAEQLEDAVASVNARARELGFNDSETVT
jgi:5-(carboxyamino)imidazole ribonucleotide synthase